MYFQPCFRLLQVFFEYVMLRGVNDNPEQAHELGALLRGRNVVQNLIPWNPIYRCALPAGRVPCKDLCCCRRLAPRHSFQTASSDVRGRVGRVGVQAPSCSRSAFQSCTPSLALLSVCLRCELLCCRSPTISFEAPGTERTLEFQRILKQEYGVPTTIRKEKASSDPDANQLANSCCVRPQLPSSHACCECDSCSAKLEPTRVPKQHASCKRRASQVRPLLPLKEDPPDCRARTSAAHVGSWWWRHRSAAAAATAMATLRQTGW